ncbi:MAG: DUF2235 domain-containing protein [Bryobacterales bacterium]|nr:DUF2235 domain-containing protein [Bryobacterales bacterium]
MKNIVICCDGTGNEYGKNNTNVVETYALAMKTATQLTYYDPGVGTGGWTYNEESGALRALTDQGTGAGLQKNVNDAYRYLMEVYEGSEANRIFVFGFSRGAFTARSLAGMLHKVALLERNADNHLEYAAKIYNQPRNSRVAAGFKATFSRPAPVHFIGVWDTVESLVLNEGKRWVDARLNPEISFAYHALAIDEKRRDFQPCLWDEQNRGPGQIMEQVWFAGVHSDVGGYHPERGLANISLHWMLGKAEAAGLEINRRRLRSPRYRPDPNGPSQESYTGFWRFRGEHVRHIPGGSKVHRSVWDRRDNGANAYSPENLPNRDLVRTVE